MSQREPFEWVEFDIDYCTLSYGTGACTAVLGTTGVRKCYNMFANCQDQENFDPGVKTVRICSPTAAIPVGMDMFPALINVSASTATVNIGGSDANLSAFGRRGTINFTARDFAYHDRFFDKYQAERISGAAQTDESGYDPAARGTIWAKLRARWPYYSGRPLRKCEGYIDGGTLVTTKTRHFVFTEMAYDSVSGTLTGSGKDILDLADNKKAVAPQSSRGVLFNGINDQETAITLAPAGIGDDEYPASGIATIGSEMVSFTRTADAVTLTERGLRGTEIRSHDADDNFQLSYSINLVRIDAVIYDLLVNYAGIDPAFIPFADWQSEVNRWATNLLLSTDIPKPTGVATLIGEFAVLGASIWWDDVAQEIGLKMIRPVDGEPIFNLTDDSALKALSIEDMDEDRITEISFSSVIVDPTRSATDNDNFSREYYAVALLEKSPNAFRDTRRLKVVTRWLNQGDDRTVRITGRRLLNRLNTAPQRLTCELDAKDDAIALTDVLNITSRGAQDVTGKASAALWQVISRKELRSGHDFEVKAQRYFYDGRFGYCMENDAPTYDAASAEERETGNFAVDSTSLVFSDGTGPYEAI